MRKQTFLSHTNRNQNHSASTNTVKLSKPMRDKTISNHIQDLAAVHHIRRLLLEIPGDGGLDEEGTPDLLSPTSPQPVFQHLNGTRQIRNFRQPQRQTPSSFDSSMALTILVLLTALFFMGFFSLYLRRYSTDEDSEDDPSRRRRPTSVPHLNMRDDQRRKGLDPSTVRSLPLVSYGEDAKQGTFSECPICLSEFERAEIIKIIPGCRHVFHPKCIDTWLASHVSCPLCRSTKFCTKKENELRLDVKQEQDNNAGVEVGGRSTVDVGATSTDVGMRRICSWTSLNDRIVLQRSMSF